MAAEDNNDGGGRWQRTMAADDDGTQDWAEDYDGEGRERAANNGGIRQKGRRRRFCFRQSPGPGTDLLIFGRKK